MVAIFSFLICILTVIVLSLINFKKDKVSHSVLGYFLAGRNNGFWLVGSTLLLTNLSTNQLIGENESVYINNLSIIGWGVTSVIAMLLVSEFLLPIYFKHGFLTVPDYLSKRFDGQIKRNVSLIILLGYIVNLLPPALYGGAVSIVTILNMPEFFNISYWESIWCLVFILASIGSLYSIFGGLKLISHADLILGIGLFFLAFLIPVFGLLKIGNGDMIEGISVVLSNKREHLNAIGNNSDAVPFSTLFTGMFLINIYYWGMEPYIAQQLLSAKSLKVAQKGMYLAAGGKLLLPLILNLPGLLALHLFPFVEPSITVFPKLLLTILPEVLIGFSLMLIFGAALTTYMAGLKSCGSLFVLNVYKPFFEKKGVKKTELTLLRAAKYFEFSISLLAVFIAPFILFAEQGFYTYLQKVSGFFNMPIFTIIVISIFNKKVNSNTASFGLVLYILLYFILDNLYGSSIHFLHLYAIIFLIVTATLWLLSFLSKPYHPSEITKFYRPDDLPKWKYRHLVSFFLVVCMIGIYILFSPLILAK